MTPVVQQAGEPTDLEALLDELRGLIDLEGFGCACEPEIQCGTCKARSVLSKTLRPVIDKYAALLASRPQQPQAETPLTDEQLVAAVEQKLGMGAGAWDCIAAVDIAKAFRAALNTGAHPPEAEPEQSSGHARGMIAARGLLRGMRPPEARADAGLPAGWKLVPIEPTPEMLAAVLPAFNAANYLRDAMGRKREPLLDGDIYRAMVAASPIPPKT